MRVVATLLAACSAEPDGRGPVARGATVDLGPEVVCDDPASRDLGRFDRAELPAQPRPEAAMLASAGIVAADLTGDGRIDLFLPHELPGASQLFVGAPDRGLLLESERLAGIDLEGAVGGSAADYDGDADLDLFVTRWERPNVLLRNDGTGRFTDVTAEAGLDAHVHFVPAEVIPPEEARASYRSQSSTWADVDLDGDLDLYVGNYGIKPDELKHDDPGLPPADPDELWLNDGDGTFTDAADLVPLEIHHGYTFMSTFLDVDGDAFPELFVWNDFGTSWDSHVLKNEAGRGFSYAPGVTFIDHDFESMGIGIADLDRDGLPDFAVSSWREAALLLSERSASSYVGAVWVDATAARGVVVAPDDPTKQQVYGWGTEFGDLDNDRDDDLVMLFGYWSLFPGAGDPFLQADALWLNHDDGAGGFVFEEVADDPLWAVRDPAIGRGLVIADLDGDGFLDLVKRFLGVYDGTAVVAAPTIRYSGRCDDARWTRIALRQPDGNVHAIGARVTVTSPDGLTQTRWVTAGSTSMYSSGPPEVHFGLGTDERFDVEVRWPDGATATARNLPARRPITLTRD